MNENIKRKEAYMLYESREQIPAEYKWKLEDIIAGNDAWEELFFKIGESLANAIVGLNGFVEKWKNNITNWWNDDVTPWFTLEKWK